MLSPNQFNTMKTVLIIERDIEIGGIKTVKQLLARTGKASIPYSAYVKLLNKLNARKQKRSMIPMFLRKQTF